MNMVGLTDKIRRGIKPRSRIGTGRVSTHIIQLRHRTEQRDFAAAARPRGADPEDGDRDSTRYVKNFSLDVREMSLGHSGAWKSRVVSTGPKAEYEVKTSFMGKSV